ncbi:MAG: DUF1566 domain-containing protein, partial [Myxococcaceae bacterium]
IGTNIFARCVACSVPPTTGLLAAWNASTGVYADATNQTNRYIVSNGIVTDSFTGIQWQQNASTTAMNWTDAQRYCANQTTGSLSGWRVPNIGELGTLVDYTARSPYVNTTAFPSMPASNFWSASSDIGMASYSWYLFFSGYARTYSQTTGTSSLVRCVRSCYKLPLSIRYIVGTGRNTGTVIDSVTGLTWQKLAPATTYTQSGAAGYCSSLILGGFTSNWRLPTIKELQTLVDYSVSQNSLIMDSVFSGERVNWYWSSTPWATSPANGWGIYFGYGSLDEYGPPGQIYVRCVRNG